MKTSEFISKVESLHKEVSVERGFIYVKTHFGTTCARVYLKGRHVILDTDNMDLAKIVLEYAETPIEEREEEKKYRVRIPDSPERTPVYALCKLVNGCVVINQTNESNFQEHDRYRLTEAEIKRNHEHLWQFAKEVAE